MRHRSAPSLHRLPPRSLLSIGLLLLGITTLVTACHHGSDPATTVDPADRGVPSLCNPDSPCPGSTCATAITPALARIPADACPRFGEFQSDVDVYSWNTFIALAWPADTSTCTADTGKSVLDGTGPLVWETFALDDAVFVAAGDTPGPYCQGESLRGPRRFDHLRKVSDTLSAESMSSIVEADHNPLVDLHGRFVRYEKRLNRDEYNYLLANDLWNKAGQAGVTFDFPDGDPAGTSCDGGPCGKLGAMEVKASWKVLTEAEAASGRFYTIEAIVYNDQDESPSPGENPVTVGLVGLHIIHKTRTQETWFWSTFEQVDNVRENDGHGPSFFEPGCTDCAAVNTPTATEPYTELAPDGTPLNQPAQVTRVNTPQDDVAPLNAYYRGLLAGSVWEHYELIGTQWATGGAPKGTPAVLANTTIETFFQDTSTCLGCHHHARSAAGMSADFSFLVGEAQ